MRNEKPRRNTRFRLPSASPFRRWWDLAPDVVFLNHGSFGACPRPILELQGQLRGEMESEPVQFLWRRFEERLDPARAALARFVGARARDLVFVGNATTGVNAVIRSLRLNRGDELLTTDQNYNACHNVLVEVARRAGARVVVARIPFPLRSEDEILEGILKSVSARTRLAMIDHVSSNAAVVFPLKRIIQELAARNVDTLIDGAHAPGMVPLKIDALQPAYYTGNLHKWVCAPKGAAFLWAREDRQDGLQPAVISHGNSRPRKGYSGFQDRFDWAGTVDPTPWFCVAEAIGWMGRLLPGGWPEVRRRNHALAVRARTLLCERLGVETPCADKMLGSMAAIPLPSNWPRESNDKKIGSDQRELYERHGIEVPFQRFGNPERRWFRVSAQVYNTIADYEYLASALEEMQTDARKAGRTVPVRRPSR